MKFRGFKTLVIDPAVSLSIKNVAIIGGEPFMKKDLLLKVVKYCKDKDLRVFIGTNGTLITEEFAFELEKVGIDSIWISIYGAREQSHDFITQTSSSFKEMLRGLEILSETKLEVGIQLVPMKPTWKEQSAIVDLVRKYGVKRIEIFRLAPVGRAIDNWEKILLSREEIQHLEEVLIAKAKETGIIIAPAGFATMQIFLD
jgi:MoaA/NifB/PqqE/SkfB family radical SAM enzyme